MSTFKDTSFTLQPPPPYNQFHHYAEQPSLEPNNLVPPDDVPSFPPPDYAVASEYPALPFDDAPPDYATLVSSTTTTPQESVQQE